MSNIMDLLLKSDEIDLTTVTKDVEVTRLTKKLGAPAIFTCEAVPVDKYEQLKENSTHMNGDKEELNVIDLKVHMILEGVKSPNFKSEDLRSKYKAATPKELVKKLLNPGEINKLSEEIMDLSGFGEGAVQEVKNS